MRWLCSALIVASVACACPARAATAIWIDTDAACGEGAFADVDDCWALALALQSPELDVRGISTVFGNAAGAKTYRSALHFVRLMRSMAPPPIHRGAAVAGAAATSAVKALRQSLNEKRLTVLALGPLTNVAALIKTAPASARRISRIIAVMGRRSGEVFRVGSNPLMHLHDMNVRKDPEAVRTVLESGIPLTVISFRATSNIRVTNSDLQILARRGGVAGMLAEISDSWFSIWRHLFWADGFRPFDAIAVLHALRPEAFQCNRLPARVTPRRFFTTFNVALEVTHATPDARFVAFCDDVDPKLKTMLMISISGGQAAR